MATPNYGYEKRQRELAKKRKKEDKARAKAARKTGLPVEGEDEGTPGIEDGSGAPADGAAQGSDGQD
ncbi:MAG TPA: hypothetical protein PKA16_08605 [Ottowia sp.]|uniref:hypothetical protein n=1 Tax=Ottowia sp. TaxID=1898956 RepID=UPI002CC29D9E|nr:hypothetical protein [Ottowia sp.]HMN21441.1 hypothetical protein [Ottowia sp.]